MEHWADSFGFPATEKKGGLDWMEHYKRQKGQKVCKVGKYSCQIVWPYFDLDVLAYKQPGPGLRPTLKDPQPPTIGLKHGPNQETLKVN